MLRPMSHHSPGSWDQHQSFRVHVHGIMSNSVILFGCKHTRQRGQWVIRTWSKCRGEARVSTMLAPTLTLRVWRRLPLEPPDSPGDQWETAVRGESDP